LVTLLSAAAAAWGDTVCFEAEHANEVTFPFEIEQAEDASGERCLTIPEGAGCSHAYAGDAGTATFRTVLKEGGKYSVWLRAWWNGNCSSSIFVKLTGPHPKKAESQVFRKWHWVWVGNWELKEGETELSLVNREDGVRIDQVVFSTEKLNLPRGPVKGSILPGLGDKELPEPRVFLGSASGTPGLPPTDFRLTHSGKGVMHQEPFRTVVLNRPRVPLTVWIRNNRLKAASGTVEIVTDAPVDIRPAKELTFAAKEGEALTNVEFAIGVLDDTARRAWNATVRIIHDNGKVEARRFGMSRPYQWVVSKAMSCPEASGIETPCGVEDKVKQGFPVGATWTLARESANTPFGLLDMRRAVADKTYVMAYAYTSVRCTKAGEYLLDVRHDDMIRIWLNGEDVFTGVRSAPSDSTRKLVRVRMWKGENHLLVKICQLKNYWEFGIRVLTPEMEPAPVTGEDVSRLPIGEVKEKQE